MYELWEAGDFDAARDLHYRLHSLVDLLFVETNPAQQGRIVSDFVRPRCLAKPPGCCRTDGGEAGTGTSLAEARRFCPRGRRLPAGPERY
jgi:hypothetical protein